LEANTSLPEEVLEELMSINALAGNDAVVSQVRSWYGWYRKKVRARQAGSSAAGSAAAGSAGASSSAGAGSVGAGSAAAGAELDCMEDGDCAWGRGGA
jgi:hypothetical protein